MDGVVVNATRLPPHRVRNIQPLRAALGTTILVYPLLHLAEKANLDGCLAAVSLGGVPLLPLAQQMTPGAAWEHGSCAASWDDAGTMGLVGKSGWLEKRLPASRASLRLSFRFRSHSADAELFSLPFLNGQVSGLRAVIKNGRVQLDIQGLDNLAEATSDLLEEGGGWVSGGSWEEVEVREAAAGLVVRVGSWEAELSSAALQLPVRVSRLRLGGDGFRGCFSRLRFDHQPLAFHPSDRHSTGDITWGRCAGGQRSGNPLARLCSEQKRLGFKVHQGLVLR